MNRRLWQGEKRGRWKCKGEKRPSGKTGKLERGQDGNRRKLASGKTGKRKPTEAKEKAKRKKRECIKMADGGTGKSGRA